MSPRPVRLFVLAAVACALYAAPVLAATCPPPGFSSVSNFSLADYIARPWFPQQQSPNSYQPVGSLFCVRAEYRQPSPPAGRILVFNQAKRGSVTGPRQNPSNSLLNAVVRDSQTGKLAVGPSFIPTALYGPYWVVAAGPGSPGTPDFTGYEWAIVSGGPPTEQGSTPNTCRNPTGSSLLNPIGSGEGLWLFTRESVANSSTVDLMRGVAASKGFDVSVLVPVAQAGCSYEPFPAQPGPAFLTF